MTHAAIELIDAMAGLIPSHKPDCDERELRLACTGQLKIDLNPSSQVLLMANSGWSANAMAHEDLVSVTCPACLALMSEARGKERTEALAVHADAQMERAG